MLHAEIGSTLSTTLGPVTIGKFLGKGKAGYSYLATTPDGESVVAKLFHDEPFSSYDFGDTPKLERELQHYQQLKASGIPLPELLDANPMQNFIIKEYIDGPTASEQVIAGDMSLDVIRKVMQIQEKLKPLGINPDFFPSNFVIQGDDVYYVDYEANFYADEWNFPNWGIYYWANPEGLRQYLETDDPLHINVCESSGKPLKEPGEAQVEEWLASL